METNKCICIIIIRYDEIKTLKNIIIIIVNIYFK